MRGSPLHSLAQMIRNGEPIGNQDLLDALGRDGTITAPLHGGGDRLLPSGEILSVLADGAGVPLEQVLARNFRMNPEEIKSANDFFRLVQFTENEPPPQAHDSPEQPFQPFDH